MKLINGPLIKYYWGVVPSMAYSSEWFQMNVQTDSTNGLSESLKTKGGKRKCHEVGRQHVAGSLERAGGKTPGVDMIVVHRTHT